MLGGPLSLYYLGSTFHHRQGRKGIMRRSYLLAALVAAACSLSAGAADLTAIPRVIQKEPQYRGAPRYCLLVFGAKADTRIWIVQDGHTFYVDRNGNGDLTEPGERLPSDNGVYLTVDQIVERDGTVHNNLHVTSHSNGVFTLTIDRRRDQGQFVGIGRMDRPSWGDRAGNAPIIHLNGPMTLERYGPVYTLPRMNGQSSSRAYKLRLMVGTPGLGKGTFASYDDLCTENLGPVQADIEYPNPDPFGEPIQQRVELLHDG
jgi:hypothetical protein